MTPTEQVTAWNLQNNIGAAILVRIGLESQPSVTTGAAFLSAFLDGQAAVCIRGRAAPVALKDVSAVPVKVVGAP